MTNEQISLKRFVDVDNYCFYSDKFQDRILVYKFDGEFFAVSQFCPHFGGPLELRSKDIYCPWHGLSFGCKNNSTNHPTSQLSLQSYNVNLVDEVLEISK